MTKVRNFKAKLIAAGGGEGGGAWTCLAIPFDAHKAYGSRGRIAVRGTVNGFAFRSSIFPDGKGGHFMMVNKTMQAGAAASQGDTVRVAMEVDSAPREVKSPADLTKALKAGAASKLFAGLSPSSQKEFVDWIEAAKRPETRQARIEKAVARVAAGKRRLDD